MGTSRTTDGIAFEIVGRGQPLVLLHGGSGRRQWFSSMAPLLQDDHQLVLIDLPGHGESRHTPGAYRLQDTAEFVKRVLDHVSVGPAWLFGHSHGAHVSLVLAANSPHLVTGIIDGDAPLGRERMRAHQAKSRDLTLAWRALTGRGLTPEQVAERLLELEIRPEPDRSVSFRELFGPGHPYILELSRSLACHDGDLLDAILDRFDDTYAALEGASLLERLRCRLVLLQADPAAGGLLTQEDIDMATRALGDVTTIRLTGVGHGLQLQDPRQVADAVRSAVGAERRVA
ncbi:alpha/beta hydrolase [Archangium violaceum]|nr:alpha/beta hydrolase [Archangium violaceum]